MSQSPLDPAPLTLALARTRVSVLVALAFFALVIATQEGGNSAALEAGVTTAALCLAIGSIAARHLAGSRSRPPQQAVALALAGLLLALGVGALGLFVCFAQEARESGVLLAFGGFILAIPRPRIAALLAPPGG